MGILNLTPDSFSDGGRVRDAEHALDLALAMAEDGAAIVDVGGESTRPGAQPVAVEEELHRVIPFLERAAAQLPVPLSIDTRRSAVARAALDAGAAVVNDVSGLAHDPTMGEVVAETGAGLVLMHMRGDPGTMAGLARYRSVSRDVAAELAVAVERARAAGIPDASLVVDPGIGFAKKTRHSLALLGDLGPILALGFPVMVGPSRKRFLGAVLDAPPEERLAGTLAACVAAYLGGARVFRVHDVRPAVQALAVAYAVSGAGSVPEQPEEAES
ncbi:MAG: dihydropteroate synthase [Gemmatimonadetes bacterium]|nr:dihydropteroate synthase [Gemmatimonadota bacterium]